MSIRRLFYRTQCRIVSRTHSGKLELDEKNFDKVVKSINQDSQVCFLSVIGPEKIGKSFWTNLIWEALEQKRNNDWESPYKRKASPLGGFSYGHGPNQVTKGCRIPSSSTSGIYIWQKSFEFNKNLQLCLLHVNYVPGDPWAGPQDSLQLFLVKLSAILVELMDGNNVIHLCQTFESEKLLKERDLRPDSLSVLISAKRREAVGSTLHSLPRAFTGNRDVKAFFVPQNSTQLHDHCGRISDLVEIDKFCDIVDQILAKSRLSTVASTFTLMELKTVMKKMASEGSSVDSGVQDMTLEGSVSKTDPSNYMTPRRDGPVPIPSTSSQRTGTFTESGFVEGYIFVGNGRSLGSVPGESDDMCFTVCQQLKQLVSNEMQSLITDSSSALAPDVISELYNVLQKECDQILLRFYFNGNQFKFNSVVQEFWESLCKIKKEVSAANSIKLDQGQKQVVNLIKDEIREYMKEMDQLIQENPRGVTKSEFSLFDRAAQEGCLNRLKENLGRSFSSSSQQSSVHSKTFLHRIAKRAADYQNENDNNLKNPSVSTRYQLSLETI